MKNITLVILFLLFTWVLVSAQSNEAKVSYNNAVRAYSAKDYSGAVSLLSETVDSFPKFIQAQRLMAESYKKLGNEESTQEYYKRVLDISPNQPEIWFSYALSFKRSGDEEKAKEALKELLAIKPEHEKAKNQLAFLEKKALGSTVAEKEESEGRKVVKVAIVEKENKVEAPKEEETTPTNDVQTTPNKTEVKEEKKNTISNAEALKYANKAVNYYNEKLFKEAALAFEKALEADKPSAKLLSFAARAQMHNGDVDRAIVLLKKAVAKDSDNGEYCYYLSRAYEMKGVENLTEKYAKMAKTRGFKATSETFNNEATEHYNKGVDFYHEKRYADAVKEFLRAIKANDKKVKYHYNLAITYVAMKREKDAKKSLKDAISVDPTYPHAYKLMGNLIYDEGKYRQAAAYYIEAINLGEDDYNSFMNVGYCYDKLGAYKQALEYFVEAEKRNPDHHEVAFSVAMAYYKVKEFTECKKRFEVLLAKDPKNTRVLNNISTICGLTGDFEKGLEYAMTWIELDSNDGEAYSQAADMLFNLRRSDEADKYRRKAKSLGVNRQPMHY